MKALASAIVISGFLSGCGQKLADSSSRSAWRIESWADAVFTIEHEGLFYQATCDGTTAFDAGHSVVRSSDGSIDSDGQRAVTLPPKCESAIGLVGHDVQSFDSTMLPAGGRQKDADGWTVTMAHVGSTLMLRRWHDKDTHGEELFRITSVTK
jgi:hypothetical protein